MVGHATRAAKTRGHVARGTPPRLCGSCPSLTLRAVCSFHNALRQRRTTMTATELAKRQERAVHETFVISRTRDGFRVYAPTEPKRQYMVSEDEDGVHCTCPDFQTHADDSHWRCKHIL